VAAGVLVLAGLASWWQLNAQEATETKKVTEVLAGEAEPLKRVNSNIQNEVREIEALEKYAQPLISIIHDREYWLKVIDDLNVRLPKDYIWITAFEPPTPEELKKINDAEKAAEATPKKKPTPGVAAAVPDVWVTIRGIYLSRDAGNDSGLASTVDAFLANLKESPYVTPVEDERLVRDQDISAHWGFKFAIPLKLKNPIDL
jgi:hypothetical protein